MIKEKIDPDGFPTENELVNGHYNCDNCGKEINFDKGYRVDAIGEDNGEEIVHLYSFCDKECAEELARDNGLKMIEATESDDLETVYKFTLDPTAAESSDPVAAAVKSIDVGVPADEPTSGELDLTDPVHERKVVECWKEVVSQAQEIEKLARTIVETNETLKGLKKEYEALVNRQNSFILTNGNGIQMTFEDCEDDVIQSDPLAWRDEPVTTLTNYGLTDKQADKAQEAFGTLGRLQDWLCADYRDKQPGIGQALQDKLTDALNKYTDMIYKTLPNEENNDESAR